MRLILSMLLSFTLFSACSHYQYNTISSPHLRQNDRMEFVAENDTMRMEYNFSGAHVHLSFENKLDVPVFIDWQRSALIVDKTSFSYAPPPGTLKADVNNLGVTAYNAATTTTHTISGSIVLPETMEFIPPHTLINKSPMYLPGRKIGKLPDSVSHSEPIPGGRKGQHVKVANFTEDNSPLRFRSYITCMVGVPAAQPVAYEHHFYVSESMSTNLNTLYFQERMQDGNRYLISSSSGAGVFALVLIGLAVALDASRG